METVFKSLDKAGSFSVFNITMERRGKKREIITAWGICIWSPIQVGTLPNREEDYNIMWCCPLVWCLCVKHTFFFISKTSPKVTKKEKIQNKEQKIGMNILRIIIACFGDQTRSGTFFINCYLGLLN